MYPTIRPRRLFVSGGSHLSDKAALLWQELGALLAFEDGLIVITGGLKGFEGDPSALTADRMIVQGMLPVLHQRGVFPNEHIETVLPGKDERKDLKRFDDGSVHTLEKRTSQARRFHMVHSADVVVSLEGDAGTRSVLDVALAIERPMLPLPFTGTQPDADIQKTGSRPRGLASKEMWNSQIASIKKWFQLDQSAVDAFNSVVLDDLPAAEIKDLAIRVRDHLMKGFTQGCFVIMRFHEDTDPVFDQAIEPAIRKYGYHAWRTDRVAPVGDIIRAIRDGISHCHFAIADTTDDRPNIMYELGFAHAIGKPVILLRRNDSNGVPKPAPFDFGTHSILYYDDTAEGRRYLKDRLDHAIAFASGKTTK